jgi:hypothetical protein
MTAAERVRCRKARRSGVVGCGHWVQVGQQIVSRDRGPWRCMACALATVRAGESTVRGR